MSVVLVDYVVRSGNGVSIVWKRSYDSEMSCLKCDEVSEHDDQTDALETMRELNLLSSFGVFPIMIPLAQRRI